MLVSNIIKLQLITITKLQNFGLTEFLKFGFEIKYHIPTSVNHSKSRGIETHIKREG